MYCVSVSYKNADVEIRKKFGFSENEKIEIIKKLINNKNISECVVLCTCNRTELYFCGIYGCEKDVIQLLSEKSGISLEILSKYILRFSKDGALIHLFRVCCGIDSMVIGEDEILGQVKTAYALAKKNNSVSFELNRIFQSAFACAKRIKTETALSKTSVSVATLTANEVSKFGESVNVLVIGASGKIGSTVLKNLVSHKNISVTTAFRKYNLTAVTAENLGAKVINYNERYNYINKSDCIISCTTSPHYTITMYDLSRYITDTKQRLFIDLAVPPDIDEKITFFDGVKLFNIDYFEHLAKENNAIKLDSVENAKEIINEEVDELKKDLIFHIFRLNMENMKKNISDIPSEKIIYKMKSEMKSDIFSEFLKILESDL